MKRRNFLAFLSNPRVSSRTAREPSKVVWVHAPDCLDAEDILKQRVAERMIDAVFRFLPGSSSLFRSEDRVAIKLNCLAGPGLSPKPQLVYALARKVVEFGVKPHHILLWDRSSHELHRAGFDIRTEENGIRTFGTDALSPGYESEPFVHRSVGSCYSRILTQFATVVIGVSVMKDHDLSGVSLGMKNFFGAIHNPNKYHDNHCDPYMADLCSEPVLRERWRLSIVDATHAQCHGGPALNPAYRWPERCLLAGMDPVAVDWVGWNRIEEKRRELGLKSLEEEKRPPSWLMTAEQIGLGMATRPRIEILRTTV